MEGFSLIKIEGKPLEKLIEVISNGIGTLYKPRAIKKEATARAYEIQVIERAKSLAILENKELEAESLSRIQSRILDREITKQNNIDNISEIAALQLSNEKNISEEKVEKDWAIRFFNIAEDVSDQDMQQLWGKILAGEVSNPKSYSIRTLELLKNLTKNEAEIFIKFSQNALNIGDNWFIYEPNDEFLKEEFGIDFTDKLLLAEVGLIATENNLSLSFPPVVDEDELLIIRYGKKTIKVYRNIGTPLQQVNKITLFTRPGNELIKLLEPVFNDKYFEKVCSLFSHDLVTIENA